MNIKERLKQNKWLYEKYSNYYIKHCTTKYSLNQKLFIKLNSNVWSTIKSNKKPDGIIYVTFTTPAPDAFWSVMKKAKAYQEKYGYKIYAILEGRFKNNRNIASIIGSYGIDGFIFHNNSKYMKKFIKYNENATIVAKKIYNPDTDIMDFINSSIDNVKLGDLIYDTIIRRNCIVTLKQYEQRFFNCVVECLSEYYFYKDLFSKENAKVFITNEYAYIAGIAIRTAFSAGLITECINEDGELRFNESNLFGCVMDIRNRISQEELSKKLKEDIKFREDCEQYFKNRMLGKINVGDAANAYMSKRQISKEHLKKMLSLDVNKKTILIAPHVFCDSCHQKELYGFRDYYDWLEFTLLCLRDRTDINILFKTHPSVSGFGQFEVDGLNYLKTLIPNIIQVPDDVSTALVLEICDVVITCGGTIGLEAACLGIPSVNTSKSYYYGFEIVDVRKNKEEYRNYLEHITEFNRKEDPNKIIIAKALLYLSNYYKRNSKVKLSDYIILPGDNIENIIDKQYDYINAKILDITNIKDEEYKKWLTVI